MAVYDSSFKRTNNQNMNKIKFLAEPPGGFYLTLKVRVLAHFQKTRQSRYANVYAVTKSLLFVLLFGGSYYLILNFYLPIGYFLLAWFGMGVFLLLAAMSMVHDAAHGVYSSKKMGERGFVAIY